MLYYNKHDILKMEKSIMLNEKQNDKLKNKETSH